MHLSSWKMKDSYFRVQIQEYDVNNDIFKWKSIWNTFSNLDEAKKMYHSTIFDYPHKDIRLVKAFVSDYSVMERIREVISYKKGKAQAP